ncbi:hypothetical protein HPB49_015929 [Dermacentor silvarum]|uniref:Uncharacterized protein n=1 Tax=Dermacentor silvarum TaxID=543639 RepID=A0ACB8DJJ9_DERSI|nr:hypothetical protein HPB49_015929 [Dermacentor silvarum]
MITDAAQCAGRNGHCSDCVLHPLEQRRLGRVARGGLELSKISQEDLLETLSLGFRHKKHQENGANHGHQTEKPGESGQVDGVPHAREEPRDQEDAGPVERADSGEVHAAVSTTHQLGPKYPHHGAQAERVACHEAAS